MSKQNQQQQPFQFTTSVPLNSKTELAFYEFETLPTKKSKQDELQTQTEAKQIRNSDLDHVMTKGQKNQGLKNFTKNVNNKNGRKTQQELKNSPSLHVLKLPKASNPSSTLQYPNENETSNMSKHPKFALRRYSQPPLMSNIGPDSSFIQNRQKQAAKESRLSKLITKVNSDKLENESKKVAGLFSVRHRKQNRNGPEIVVTSNEDSFK